MSVIIAIAALGGLTLVLTTMLVIANKQLYVYEDPRIEAVEGMLPAANCGACGYPGCHPFAASLVAGKSLPAKCTVSSDEDKEDIASYLGVDLGGVVKQVARLACAGGTNVARNKANYEGLKTCRAATLISGGGKGCFWGCLGFGDCEVVCDFDAIHMDKHGLPVVDTEKCTACGDCVEICPKDLFSIQPMSNQLWVACKNLEAGEEVLEECEVACTACGRCAMDAPGDLIVMENNLPRINYSLSKQMMNPIERCPTGAIIWWDQKLGALKGRASKPIIRKGARELGHS